MMLVRAENKIEWMKNSAVTKKKEETVERHDKDIIIGKLKISVTDLKDKVNEM